MSYFHNQILHKKVFQISVSTPHLLSFSSHTKIFSGQIKPTCPEKDNSFLLLAVGMNSALQPALSKNGKVGQINNAVAVVIQLRRKSAETACAAGIHISNLVGSKRIVPNLDIIQQTIVQRIVRPVAFADEIAAASQDVRHLSDSPCLHRHSISIQGDIACLIHNGSVHLPLV